MYFGLQISIGYSHDQSNGSFDHSRFTRPPLLWLFFVSAFGFGLLFFFLSCSRCLDSFQERYALSRKNGVRMIRTWAVRRVG